MGIREMVLLFLLVWTGWSWCLKTTVNLTVQATKVDYSPDGTLLAVTSVASNRVYLYETINFFKVFTYAPTGGDNVRTARFTRDGTYLGIGFDNGNVKLLSGTAPFSSTVIRTISSQNKNIADIDFNYGYDKLLVCYTSDSKIFVIKNYASASPTSDNRDTTRVQWGCKWSKNDNACEIDDDRYVKCYDVDSSGTIASTYRTRSRAADNDFRDLAVKPTTVTPIKVPLRRCRSSWQEATTTTKPDPTSSTPEPPAPAHLTYLQPSLPSRTHLSTLSRPPAMPPMPPSTPSQATTIECGSSMRAAIPRPS
jgi:WD40 repeat protein